MLSTESRQLKVLLVDDEEYARKIIMTEISRLLPGSVFYEARDGNEGLELLGKHADELDLITLDINMPNRNGRDFLLAKRENPSYSNIKVLIVSTEEAKQSFPELRELGANEFCEKPVTGKLAPILQSLLNVELAIPEALSSENILTATQFLQQLRMVKLAGAAGERRDVAEVRGDILRAFNESYLEPRQKALQELQRVLHEIELIPVTQASGESKDAAQYLSDVQRMIEQRAFGAREKVTSIDLSLDTLREVQTYLTRLAALLTGGFLTAEVLSIWDEVFQKLHNVKGHVVPPLIRDIFKFVNTELMNLARDFSSKGGSLIQVKDVDMLSDAIDWLMKVLTVEQVLQNVKNVHQQIPKVNSEEREKIKGILSRLSASVSLSDVEEGRVMIGLLGGIRTGLNVVKVHTAPIKRAGITQLGDLASGTGMVRITDYEWRLPEKGGQGPGRRYEFVFLSESADEEKMRKIFGDLVEHVEIIYRGAPVQRKAVKIGLEEALYAATIPVKIESLESIYRNVERLSISKSKVYEIRQKVEHAESPREFTHELDEVIRGLGQITYDIQGHLIRSRLVPLSEVFRSIPRRVAELNAKYSKNIRVEVSGEHEKLDKKITDELKEYFNVLIDNAHYHAFGENAEGLISVRAESREGNVIITVSDNGKGLKTDEILQKARQKGILKEGREYSREEIQNCIFTKGFSTAHTESELSGKGIGMYSVKRMVEKYFGKITVQSEEGKGSTFKMEFPNTISIDEALLVRNRVFDKESLYAIPLRFVLDVKSVRGENISCYHKDFYYWEIEKQKLGIASGGDGGVHTILPIVDISHYLDEKAPKRSIEKSQDYDLVIIREGGELVGVLVDKVERREEIVLKHMGEYLRAMQLASGGQFPYRTYTVLGDGTLVPLLDVSPILSLVRRMRAQIKELQQELGTKAPPKRTNVPDMFSFQVGGEHFVMDVSCVQRSFLYADVQKDIHVDERLRERFPFVVGVVLSSQGKFVLADAASALGISRENEKSKKTGFGKQDIISVELENGNVVGLLVDKNEGIIDGAHLEEEAFEGKIDGKKTVYYTDRSTQTHYKKFQSEPLLSLPKPELVVPSVSDLDTAVAMPTEIENEEKNLLLFAIGGWQFAIRSSLVYTVQLLDEETRSRIGYFPRFAKYVEGLTNVNGQAMPYVHLKERIGLGERTGDEKNVVVVQYGREEKEDKEFFGFIVDGVFSVLSGDDFTVSGRKDLPPLLDPKYVADVGHLSKRDDSTRSSEREVFFILDVAEILESVKAENVSL
ncbi:MAG: chemotaxis protein CheW [Bacteroidota bacterium]